MKNKTKIRIIYTLAICTLMVSILNIQAQQVSIKVISVKGKVSYNSNLLKRMQTINAPNIKTFEQNLKYSPTADIVKVVYNNTLVTYGGWSLDTHNKLTGLYTKGAKVLINPSDFKTYFGQKEIWLWKDDTVIVKPGCGIKLNNKDTLFTASYIFKDEAQDIQINKNDTVIFSKKNLYYRSVNGKYKWINSFEVESFNLSFYNPNDSKEYLISNASIPVSNVYFVDDYVHYLHDNGINANNINSELIKIFGIKSLSEHFICKEEEVKSFLEKYVASLTNK